MNWVVGLAIATQIKRVLSPVAVVIGLMLVNYFILIISTTLTLNIGVIIRDLSSNKTVNVT